MHRYNTYNYQYLLPEQAPQKNIYVSANNTDPNFSAYPTVVIAIIGQALLKKSDLCPLYLM